MPWAGSRSSRSTNAPAWPNGPLLDPIRLPWRDINQIKQDIADEARKILPKRGGLNEFVADARIATRTRLQGRNIGVRIVAEQTKGKSHALRSRAYKRRHGLKFRMAVAMEDQTLPLGLASLFAGAGAQYSWRGVCGCASRLDNKVLGARPREISWWIKSRAASTRRAALKNCASRTCMSLTCLHPNQPPRARSTASSTSTASPVTAPRRPIPASRPRPTVWPMTRRTKS